MTDLIELAERWKAHKRFRWASGMETDHYGIIVHADKNQWVEDGVWWGVSVFEQWLDQLPEEALPDLSDPATVGLLEHQVLELYGGDQFSVRADTGMNGDGTKTIWWRVKDLHNPSLASGSVVLVGTDHAKISCLVNALERYDEVSQ